MLKLFGHKDSGHAYKVRLCLSLNQIEHDYEVVDIWQARDQRQTEFQQNAKFQEVPLLIDNGQAMAQSDAILVHLATQHGAFDNNNPETLQSCLEWLFWEANKIGLCLPQLRYAKRFAPDEFTPGALQWLNQRYEHDVGILEKELSDGRPFILGERPSIADCSLCGYLFFADEAELTVPPAVQRWLTSISELTGWQHPYELMQ